MVRRGSREKATIETKIKLRFPCELSIRYFLPIVRAIFASELIKKHRVSQVTAAEILDITQPAISMYINSGIPLKRLELEETFKEIQAVVGELADDICRGNVTQTEAMMRICSLCIWLRIRGPICKIHESIIPTLRGETCSLCLRDLTAERRKSLEEYKILDNVRHAVQLIENSAEFSSLIPEIGTNIVMAKVNAKTTKDVVGVQGRISIVGGRPRATGPPKFGSSSHVANAVLTVMKYDGSIRSAINIKFDWLIVEICKEMGLKISFYDRSEETPEIKMVNGRTIPWGINKAVKRVGTVPDMIYDLGDVGKEPMLFLFKSAAFDVAYLAVRIAKKYYRRKQSRHI